MKQNILMFIFLIIWLGIGSYLFYLDRQIRKLKKQLMFKQAESESKN